MTTYFRVDCDHVTWLTNQIRQTETSNQKLGDFLISVSLPNLAGSGSRSSVVWQQTGPKVAVWHKDISQEVKKYIGFRVNLGQLCIVAELKNNKNRGQQRSAAAVRWSVSSGQRLRLSSAFQMTSSGFIKETSESLINACLAGRFVKPYKWQSAMIH